MSDNLNKKQLDAQKININQDWELSGWAEKFGVSEEEIIEAVNEVGVMVKDVKEYLGK